MLKDLFISLRMLLLMTLLLGGLYPLVVTGASHLLFREKAGGSLVYKEGAVVGSSLIGRKFSAEAYFHGRPSACGYNTMPSGASNAGYTNAVFIKTVHERESAFAAAYPNAGAMPADLLFASGSGLDPHISAAAAEIQLDRVAKMRTYSDEQKRELASLIVRHTEKRQFGFLGEERVNVLLLNLALDSPGR